MIRSLFGIHIEFSYDSLVVFVFFLFFVVMAGPLVSFGAR